MRIKYFLLIFVLALAACGESEEDPLPTQMSLDQATTEPTAAPTEAEEDPTPTAETVQAQSAPQGDDPVVFNIELGNFRVADVEFSPDNSTIAVTDEETLRLIESATGEVVNEFAGDRLIELAYSPDGNTIAYYDRAIYMLDLATGEATELLAEDTLQGDAEQIMFSPDGSLLAHSAGSNGRVQVLDLATGEARDMVERPELNSHRFIFSNDGSQIFADSNQEVQVHDVATGELVDTLTPDVGRIYGLATNGDQLFILGDDQFAVWNLTSNALATSYEFERRSGQRFAVNDSGTQMVVNLAGRVPVLDPMTGEEIVNLQDQTELIPIAPFEMDISPNGTLLVHATLSGGNLWVWELPSE